MSTLKEINAKLSGAEDLCKRAELAYSDAKRNYEDAYNVLVEVETLYSDLLKEKLKLLRALKEDCIGA